MRKSKNKSIIEKFGKQYLKKIIEDSSGMSGVLREYGLSTSGSGSRVALKRLCLEWDIELVFTKPVEKSYKPKYSFEEVFCLNSGVSKSFLKDYIIKNDILNNKKCHICCMKNNWNKKLITMILDHINGNPTDNRVENLRYICPNCNSQLSTTGSRNTYRVSKNIKPVFRCKTCGIKITKGSEYCKKHIGISRRKVERPSVEELKKELSVSSYVALGKKYGVSDNAIRKWILD